MLFMFHHSVDSSMTSPVCSNCSKKDAEIAYLKAVISLDSLGANPPLRSVEQLSRGSKSVAIEQQIALMRSQLAVIRADVLYMNRHIHSVLQWIAKVISVFLSCCGRLGEAAAASVVHSASSVLSNASKSQCIR
jgi:hypothetical protein